MDVPEHVKERARDRERWIRELTERLLTAEQENAVLLEKNKQLNTGIERIRKVVASQFANRNERLYAVRNICWLLQSGDKVE